MIEFLSDCCAQRDRQEEVVQRRQFQPVRPRSYSTQSEPVGHIFQPRQYYDDHEDRMSLLTPRTEDMARGWRKFSNAMEPMPGTGLYADSPPSRRDSWTVQKMQLQELQRLRREEAALDADLRKVRAWSFSN
uniref:Uncharacterized protein n=1 Tax=Noctiluca scintillans TaxID=2966 RepID=A0A7S1A8W2_NOCSC|mmetsp:Transcript_36555/g.97408  ORF Transcript_36555/g.97408 Transcript_36555/m.97408 type:complete len:132 (+) Transcript_36555:34-429(+)